MLRNHNASRNRASAELIAGVVRRPVMRLTHNLAARRRDWNAVHPLAKAGEPICEQRQLWLGHLSQDTTSLYEITDPDYLREAAEATDIIIEKISALTRRSPWPAGDQPELRSSGWLKG